MYDKMSFVKGKLDHIFKSVVCILRKWQSNVRATGADLVFEFLKYVRNHRLPRGETTDIFNSDFALFWKVCLLGLCLLCRPAGRTARAIPDTERKVYCERPNQVNYLIEAFEGHLLIIINIDYCGKERPKGGKFWRKLMSFVIFDTFWHDFPSYDDHKSIFFAPAARFPKSKISKKFVLV